MQALHKGVCKSIKTNQKKNFQLVGNTVELLPGLKFTSKMVKIVEFTGKIGKAGKR
jgi:hypothetical protein